MERNLDVPGAGGRGLKHLGLQITGQVGVDRHHNQLLDLGAEFACPFNEQLLGRFNLLLAGEKDQDVPEGLGYVDLEHGNHHGVNVVCFGRLHTSSPDS